MFRHFLVTALRNFRRNGFFTLINVLGLALGMAITILILEYVVQEVSFDRFHKNRENIYRVIINEEKEGAFTPSQYITAAVAPSLADEFPDVEHFVRFCNPQSAFLTYSDKNFEVDNLTYADSSFFDVFTFRLIKGDPKTALTDPYKIILTESTAKKVFGNDEAVGKVVRLNGRENLLVTGVMEDFPANSYLNFGAMVSFSSLYLDTNLYLDWNGGWNYVVFVLLHPGSNLERLKQHFPDFMEKNINYIYRQHGFILHLDLQPMVRIHLFSNKDYRLQEAGNLASIYIFSSIAFFIMLIACINFMNLTTARSFGRAREIGLRKVAGATRGSIILQFIFETLILSALAFIIAVILADSLQSGFNWIIGTDMSILGPSAGIMLAAMALLILLTGLIAGSYPAWFMSRFQPLVSIKGTMISGKGKSVLRNILVVFQFVTSLVLITLTLVIYTQIRFIMSQPMGFDRENVLIVPMVSDNAMKNYTAAMDAFREIPEVTGVGASSDIPGSGFTMNGYFPEGLKEPIMIHVLDIDENYLDVMGIPLVQGRGFDPGKESDQSAFLINQVLAKKLGWENPVGKKIFRDGPHEVIGVVDDFHFASLHEAIQPLILTKQPWIGYNYLTVKVRKGDLPGVTKKLETAWLSVLPQEPFSSFTHEEYMKAAYEDDRILGKAVLWFSILAIFIACLGLLGLASYTYNQRRKEICIRKVLGAASSQVARSVTFSFLRLVLIAGVISVPLSWWLAHRWLGSFATKAFIGLWIYLIPVIFVAGLAWITIYFQVRRLANTNPSEVLKFE
jgi:putative ABC transport system permease protein